MKQLLLETVYDGIFKHHAMQVVKNVDGYDDLYFDGTEGCFRTTRQGMIWLTEKLLDVPTSDIAVFDLDGEGQEEIAIIEGVHRNHVAIFKRSAFADFPHNQNTIWKSEIQLHRHRDSYLPDVI